MWCMFLVYKSFSCCHLLDRSENILRVAMLNVLKSLLDLIHLDEWPQMSVMSTQKGLPKGNKQQMRIIKLNWHFRIKMLCYKASEGEGFIFRLEAFYKLGCVVGLVVDSILPHAESGPNDHRKDAPPFEIKDAQEMFQRCSLHIDWSDISNSLPQSMEHSRFFIIVFCANKIKLMKIRVRNYSHGSPILVIWLSSRTFGI